MHFLHFCEFSHKRLKIRSLVIVDRLPSNCGLYKGL